MRPNCSAMLLGVCITLTALAQHDAPKLKVSNESLTKEQIAVYRAVLQDYLKDSTDTLYLANTTEGIEQSSSIFNGACRKSSDSQMAQDSVIHYLDPAVALDLKITLVDPQGQREKIKKGDPAVLMKRVIDDHEDVPQKQIDGAIELAFKNGLFTFSEIVFNKKRNRALVSYSLVCGELCGYGNAVVLKKVGEKWKVQKTCQGWVA